MSERYSPFPKTRFGKLLLGLGSVVIIFISLPHFTPSYKIKTPEGVQQIPADIVKRKDCAAYSKFIQSLARPTFVPDNNCPWAKVGPIGHFTIGPVMMNVPREYIWLDRNQPDGDPKGLNLMFKYPEMTPGNSNALDQNANISVFIKNYPKTNEVCDKAGCVSHPTAVYRLQAIDVLDLKSPVNPLDYISFNSALNLNTYQIIRKTEKGEISSIHDVFYRGDVNSPDYWLICDERFEGGFNLNPRCEAYSYMVKLLPARIGYSRTLLQHHDRIHKKILEKINSFVVQPSSVEH